MSDIKLLSPDEVFKHGISPSMVKLWMTCKRKWYNHYVRRLREDDRKDANALFGSAIHSFLARWYSEKVDPELLIEQFKKDFPEECNTDKKNQELGIRLLRFYVKKYNRETEPFNVISTEFGDKNEITVPLDGCKYPLHFIIDMLVERSIGGMEVWDHKTASILGASYFDQYINDYQVYTYLYGMTKHLGKPVQSLMINVIGCKKTVNNDSFLRMPFEKNDAQLKYHMGHFVKQANEMIEFVEKNWQDPEAFMLNSYSSACVSYFRKCPYLEMCEYNDNLMFAKELMAKYERGKDAGNNN